MDKKEIQRQRMMKYFIDAAKEIIKEEGAKALTARKVGEKAGYSYATIYNYFNDLDTLFVYCVFDFLEDCYKHMINLQIDEKDSKEKFVQYSLAYFKYFAERPDMFHLIFIKELGKVPEELMNYSRKPSVALLLREILVDCSEDDYIPKENVDLIGELITSSIHGKLLFFVKGRHIHDIDKISKTIEIEAKFLIEKGGVK